ncbi:hypothetical protein GCM10010121_002070 [Streptomyces brasiliensis]|uniref:Uncharacterized protein n=1 Tax=Streptomyces brasiliensis TaxID=1954 RepID=A0A917NF89_9ACTN|nr:hypothetical protein GCM10010121_002070 [Streptomyces brasiliensis]
MAASGRAEAAAAGSNAPAERISAAEAASTPAQATARPTLEGRCATYGGYGRRERRYGMVRASAVRVGGAQT